MSADKVAQKGAEKSPEHCFVGINTADFLLEAQVQSQFRIPYSALRISEGFAQKGAEKSPEHCFVGINTADF